MTPQQIIAMCAYETGVPIGALKGRSRTGKVAYTRQVAMLLMREHCAGLPGKPMTYEAIGKLFGRDHGTVVHACKSVQNMADTSTSDSQLIQKLRERLGPSQAKDIFRPHVGKTLLLRNGYEVIEAHVDRLTDDGEYVRLNVEGKAQWSLCRKWTVLQELGNGVQ